MASIQERALVAVLALLSACGAQGCSSDGGTAGGPTGSGGAANETCDKIDYASYAGGTVPSFEKDVMPIFGFSCAASDCHNSRDKKAGLDLGPKCKPIPPATPGGLYTCQYPTTDPDPSLPNPPRPLTPDLIKAAYASLMAPAKTVDSPTVQRVVKGDPEHSFLIEKLAGTQNRADYACTIQDTSRSTGKCGDSMPLGAEPLCAGTGRPRFDTLARWIANGAPGDN